MDKGLTEERIAEIPNYEFSQVLTRREKLALKLAEKMGIEHQAIDDEFMTLLRSEFSEAEMVETLNRYQHLHRMGAAAVGLQNQRGRDLTGSGCRNNERRCRSGH